MAAAGAELADESPTSGDLPVPAAQGGDQLLQRHGGENGVGFQPFSVLAEDGGELSAAALDLPDPAVEKKLAPRGLKALRHGLPQLAGAEFGVVEFLDQGGLHLLILPGQELFQHVLYRADRFHR